MATIWVIIIYLGALLAFAMGSKIFFRGTSNDYFVASRSIGPFMLLMSVFGTTMTAFALVGSTGKAFERGVGTYGLMASSSGLIHAACFFLIGIKLWSIGKRHGYVTQIQFFRGRYESNGLGYLLFPILVLLVIPYLLIGVIGAAKTIAGVTGPKGPNPGMFPDVFESTGGAVPPWLTGLVICVVVLCYIFAGGSRAAAWANTFQTLVFMVMGILAFILISSKLGGLGAAIEQANDAHLVRTPSELEFTNKAGKTIHREVGVPPIMVDEGGFHYTMTGSGAGVLVQRDDREGWLAAYEAAGDGETRAEWASAGRKHVASNYPPESQLEAIERIMAPFLSDESV